MTTREKDAARALTRLRELAATFGLTIETGFPHAEIDAVAAAIGKNRMTPFIHSAGGTDAVSWTVLRRGDTYAGMVGMRLIEGAGRAFRDLAHDFLALGYGKGAIILDRAGSGLPSEKFERVVYGGDFQLAPFLFQKDRGIIFSILHTAHADAVMRWDPDAFYGYMRDRHVFRGNGQIYGYRESYVQPHRWSNGAPPNRYRHEWLLLTRQFAMRKAMAMIADGTFPIPFGEPKAITRGGLGGSLHDA